MGWAGNQHGEREYCSAVSPFFRALRHLCKVLGIHPRNTDSEFVLVDLRTGFSIKKAL